MDVMRVAVGQVRELNEEKLKYAAQLGASGINVNTPLIPGDVSWSYETLKTLVDQCESYGLRMESIENVPAHFYDKVMLGKEGRDEQIANYQETIRNCGRAGVPILGHHFMPNFVWRTEWSAPARAGAGATKFDMAAVTAVADPSELSAFVAIAKERKDTIPLSGNDEPIVTHEQMWSNYLYFMEAVLPVAEEAGVRLALHPDDPPVPMLGGVARLFFEPAGFKRAFEAVGSSPSWGLNLCLGCCSEMPGGFANVKEMIEFFGPKGKIFYCHFRDVQGEVPNFTECWLGEGNYDPAEVMLLLKKNGFNGFMLDDHVPQMDGDTNWQHRGRAYMIGYLQGMLKMMDRLS
jgi:mannonate dehydratase